MKLFEKRSGLCPAHWFSKSALLLLMCWVPLIASGTAYAATSFSFTLKAPYTTTAGAYDANGVLVRTIWRRVPYKAGSFTGTWDDKDDNGKVVPAGTYTIKVLYHNVQPVWDGAFVGNTSNGTAGRWHGFHPIQSIAIAGTAGYTTCGYNEGQAGFYRFDTKAPQSGPTGMTGADIRVLVSSLATDGTLVYATNTGGAFGGNIYSYTVAYRVSDNSQYAFPSGGSCTIPGVGTYNNCIDIDHDASEPADNLNRTTGSAVQTAGKILAVSHGPRNVIRLFDKTSGAPAGTISATYPTALAFAPNGDLWVIADGVVERFTGSTLGTTGTPATIIKGLSQPLNVAVNPSDSENVLVADGGTSQQVKAFDSTGKALWTYGQAGGYPANGIAVTNDKFYFHEMERDDFTALTVLPDGSFWIGDTNACRLLHFSAEREYIEQIAYTSESYEGEVDVADPTRVFGNKFLEYRIDYSKPLGGTNGSWTLVNNWAGNLPKDSPYWGFGCGPKHILTMSNGRTYAQTVYKGGRAIIELTQSGIRDTGVRLTDGNLENFYSDGSLRFAARDGAGFVQYFRKAFTGFDGSGNPQWADAKLLASTPTTDNDPYPFGAFDPTIPITTSNTIVSFQTSLSPGYHLGGLAIGGKSFLWKAAPSVPDNSPPDGLGSYDIGNGVTYGGNSAHALGRSIIFGYHGEFWNASEMSQWMHYYDDGLFVTQFGVPASLSAGAGFAGNAFSATLVKANGQTYLYHNDESGIGAVLRWHLLGMDSIQEAVGRGALGTTVTLTAPDPAFPTGLVAAPGDGQVTLRWNAARGAAGYTVKYSTTSGGPYTLMKGVTGTSAVVSGLQNETAYYLAVSAVVGGTEGADSNQVRMVPYDPSIPVHSAGTMRVSFGLPYYISSTAWAKGEQALTTLPRDLNDVTTQLQLDNVGVAGYYLWGQGGPSTESSHIAAPFTVKLGSGWKYVEHINDIISLDGGPRSSLFSLQANPVGTIDITCSDSNWHYLTVLSSDVFNSRRDFAIKLAPTGSASPAASYTVKEIGSGGGSNHIFQFLFKGNVTLTVENGSDGQGNVRAIFLDNAPLSTSHTGAAKDAQPRVEPTL